MSYDGRSWGSRFNRGKTRIFGKIELPPFSWKVIPFSQLPLDQPTSEIRHSIESDNIERAEANFTPLMNCSRRKWIIQTPFKLQYNPDSGQILSLTGSTSSREILSPRDGMDFFAFVRERTNALIESRRYTFYPRDLEKEKVDEMCWQDFLPIHELAYRVTKCTVKEKSSRITLVRSLEAPGMIFLRQLITFFAYDPVINLEVEMELFPESEPQSVYFAFPLAMDANWKAAFDTAGSKVLLDEEQLPGECRNWVTTNSFAAMWDKNGGIAVFTPHAPMVQFGDFHFSRTLDKITRPQNPLLLLWPVSNYWDTNFPRIQYGRINLRYGVFTFNSQNINEVQIRADSFRNPSLVWPVTTNGREPSEGPFSNSFKLI